MRSVAAVAAGYLVFAVSAVVLFQVSGRAPHAAVPTSFLMWSTAYGAAFAALGGFLAARVAPSRPVRHAAAVGLVIFALALASLLASPAGDSVWSQIAAMAVMAPAAWAGGRFAATRASGLPAGSRGR